MKKIWIRILLAAALLVGMMNCAVAGGETGQDIIILYTNDTHTYIDGALSFDVVAGMKADLENQGAWVLLADAGDHSQGTAYGSMDEGESIIRMMNAAGYDVAAVGNHEFDYGMDGFMRNAELAEYPYISCNFYREDGYVRNENVLDSYALFACGDVTVAFVGITTPETIGSTTPSYFQDEEGNYIYGIAGGADGAELYRDVQDAVDQARADGADIVIGLGHLGEAYNYQAWSSVAVIENVSGLDAFIDGHSHSEVEGRMVMDKDGQEVLLTQTGEYFTYVGMMTIDGETGDISTELIGVTELTQTVQAEDGSETEEIVGYELDGDGYTGVIWPVDPETEKIKQNWMADVDTRLEVKIGSTALVFDNYAPDGTRLVRRQETNTGDFSADALYWLFDSMNMDVDVAVMNGGGVRNMAVTGDITYKTCKEIHTFGNVACMLDVSGQMLLDALEWGARYAGEADEGSFLQVCGVTYAVDTSLPHSIVTDEQDAWVSGPTAGYRVHDVMVYDRATDTWLPLDLEKTYRMAGYSYTLRDGGGFFYMLNEAGMVVDFVMEDYMVLAHYVQAFEDGVVEAENSPLMQKYPGLTVNYADISGCGRITLE